MDLMALVRSIEEFLYELLSWFIFLPLTLWYCVRFPHRMMRYGASEITDDSEHRFAEALSPPILMFLTIGFLHLFDAKITNTPNELMAWLAQDDRNLLVFRAVVFGLLPMMFALMDLRLKRSDLTRETLRPAFYSHSYIVTPFVLMLGIAQIVAQKSFAGNGSLSLMIVLVGTVWYIAVVVNWLRQTAQLSVGKALLVTVITLFAFVVLLVSFFLAVVLWPSA